MSVASRERDDMRDEPATPAIPLRGRWTSGREFSAQTIRDAINWRRVLLQLAVSLVTLYVAATAARVVIRQYYIFLPDYARSVFRPVAAVDGPTHVFFLIADHFEPLFSAERTEEWAKRYREMAARHRDSSGRPPQHTWFYPGDQYDARILGILRQLTGDGLGEVEFHYHHDGDNAATLGVALKYAIARFQKFGFLKTVDGKTAFAFVHGNEGLDNSDGELCGVDEELRVLHAFGCFADYTFPALYHQAQPPFVNVIYAAKDDPAPKSYRNQRPLLDLKRGGADLMIFQGPLALAPSWNLRRLFIDVDDGNIHASMPASPTRVGRWVNARVHVAERPDWLFVKVFAHGISSIEDEDEVVGDHFEDALTELEQHYNDGRKYVLHYVTAREAYNLAMAAAGGAKGQPSEYLDSEIPPYISTARRVEPHVLPAAAP
jgi:hypothetical protein